MEHTIPFIIKKSDRISRLVEDLYRTLPEIEADRAELVAESYRMTEGQPTVLRRSHAFRHILENIPIVIREGELIVGSNSKKPRGCQTYPEYSYEWLIPEFETIATRAADPFYISEETKERLKKVCPYFKGKTVSDLAAANMDPHAYEVFMHHGIFTVGNYFYNGVGHLCVDYPHIIRSGYASVIEEAQLALQGIDVSQPDAASRRQFYTAVIESAEAVIAYARRYSRLARREAEQCRDEVRKQELFRIAETCRRVPAHGATSFYEACQSFWFIQQLLQLESSGHSISPGRFDVYMYPYYRRDIDSGAITIEQAQELIDNIWVKLNDLNKVRDAASAEGFAGYGLFQNLIVGGMDRYGEDVTNDLSYMCLEASLHVRLPQPSLSIRVHDSSPQSLLIKAAAVTREGLGVPAFYNDKVIIPSMMNRGIPLEEAREYCIIGCVEPQVPHCTDGWHDAAFYNMCRPMELVFSNGVDEGVQVGPRTGELRELDTFDKFYTAYKTQQSAMIKLLINAINAVDSAHAERCPLPFQSSMVGGCIEKGKPVQQGGAKYNFTGPQGFGIANMTDALAAIRELVYEKKKYTLCDFRMAMKQNFGKGLPEQDAVKATVATLRELAKSGTVVSQSDIRAIYDRLVSDGCTDAVTREKYDTMLRDIAAVDKYGNDIESADLFARDVAYTYTKEIEKYQNPRGGIYQAGLYPVSANVPLGAQTGATPDGRLSRTPIADGVGPVSGRDICGPTATANSVAKLDHAIASNGTLFNQKFHPLALSGMEGLTKFVALIRGFFDQMGMHMQFNVVSRETLIDAQNHPENYKSLVVRVAGYSALFTTLSRSLQDDIIARTEQAWNR